MANGILSYDTHLHAMDNPSGDNQLGKRSATEAVRGAGVHNVAIPSPQSFEKRRKIDTSTLPAPGIIAGHERTCWLSSFFIICGFGQYFVLLCSCFLLSSIEFAYGYFTRLKL